MTLRSFVMQPDTRTEQEPYSYTKEGKTIEGQEAKTITDPFAVWTWIDAYANGKAIGQVSFGADYRLRPGWLLGAFGRYDWNQAHFGQGGIYTALWEKGFYFTDGALFGPSTLTAFGELGYAWTIKHWLTGPVGSFQFDRAWNNVGFGRGSLIQARAGWWLAYQARCFTPQLQVMYQYQGQDVFPGRRNAIWVGAGSSWTLNERWSLFGFYAIEANDNYQEHQVDLSLRYGF